MFDSSRFFDQIDYMGSFGAYFTFNSSSEMFSEKEIHKQFCFAHEYYALTQKIIDARFLENQQQ